MSLRPSSVAFAALLVVGCASAPARERDGALPLGEYALTSTGHEIVLNGKVVISESDGIILLMDRATCRMSPLALSTRRTGVFSCDGVDGLSGVSVVIDANNPVNGSRWSAFVLRQRTIKRCAATAVRNGQEVCTRYEYVPQDYEAQVTGHFIVAPTPVVRNF